VGWTVQAATRRPAIASPRRPGTSHAHNAAAHPPNRRSGLRTTTWSMRQPLIDGQGNFGSIDGDPPKDHGDLDNFLIGPDP